MVNVMVVGAYQDGPLPRYTRVKEQLEDEVENEETTDCIWRNWNYLSDNMNGDQKDDKLHCVKVDA